MPGFLAIDPGVTTGWAVFTLSGEFVEMGQIEGFDEFSKWLGTQTPDLIICEEFRLNPKIPQGGSTMETSQVIGKVRDYASSIGVVLVMQRASILSIGYAWGEMKRLPKSRHKESHKFDASAHGYYYLVKMGIRKIPAKKRYGKSLDG